MYRILMGALLALGLFLTPTSSALASATQGGIEQEGRFTISVLIMGPSDELFARFGHIALVVEDKRKSTKKVYNFGTFDFSDPDLQSKYVRGFLDYWLSVGSYPYTIRKYESYNRELIERTLDLSPTQAREVASRLETNALPQNRTYAYRHYLDNCCTRIRDILNDVSGSAISKGRNSEYTDRTYRDYTREALRGMPVMSTLILFSLGPAVDKPITRYDEEFLPSVFGEDLDKVRFGDNNIPLVTKKRVLVKRTGPDVGVSSPTQDVVVAVVLFALLALGLALPAALGKRKGQTRLLGFGLVIWGFLAGLGGVALMLYWTATTHYDTHYNENLLCYPLTHLWLLGPGFKLLFKGRIKAKTAGILKWYLLVSLGLIAIDLLLKIGPFIQANYGFIAFAIACNLAAFLALKRTAPYSQ